MTDARSSAVQAEIEPNNFDLIRLFAALQVMLVHTAHHLGVEGRWTTVLSMFPGVPIFFFVSGFLIYRSWENISRDRARVFFTNRVLRIYPALVVCLVFSLATLAATGYLASIELPPARFIGWLVGQLTILQFYQPGFLSGYGIGTLNASLWTITVELQFYLVTPVVFWLATRHRVLALLVFVASVAANIVNSFWIDPGRSAIHQVFSVSFLPWVFMFMMGAAVSTRAGLRAAILRIPGWLLVIAYLAVYELSTRFGLGVGNKINVVAFALLAALVVKAAYSRPALSGRLLGRNDISYGLYIYHLPIVNLFVVYHFTGSAPSFALAVAATVAIATLSWIVVERPALALKKVALRRYASSAVPDAPLHGYRSPK